MSSQVIASLLAVRANTRLVLATELVARNTECEALRTRLSIAQHEVAMFARTAHDAIARNDGLDPVTGAGLPAPKTIAPRAPRPLPAHFVAAREAAMRLGKCVKVSA
jgi:hypothetical protein